MLYDTAMGHTKISMCSIPLCYIEIWPDSKHCITYPSTQ